MAGDSVSGYLQVTGFPGMNAIAGLQFIFGYSLYDIVGDGAVVAVLQVYSIGGVIEFAVLNAHIGNILQFDASHIRQATSACIADVYALYVYVGGSDDEHLLFQFPVKYGIPFTDQSEGFPDDDIVLFIKPGPDPDGISGSGLIYQLLYISGSCLGDKQ